MSFVTTFQTCLKKDPVGSLGFSQHCSLHGWSVMRLIRAWYFWLVSAGPCLSRDKTWGFLGLSSTVRFRSRYNSSLELFLCLISEEPSLVLQIQDGLELGSERGVLFGSK